MADKSYSGRCFCGAVELSEKDLPKEMGGSGELLPE